MNIDPQIPVLEQITTLLPQTIQPIGSVYHTNLQECGIYTRAGMWEQG
jgi:hypothetical protein